MAATNTQILSRPNSLPPLEGLPGVSGTLGVGVRGMRERARHVGGDLELLSEQTGTAVRLTIPTPTAEPAANSQLRAPQ